MTPNTSTGGAKREAIIDAALQLFFSKGYEGTSVRAIMTAVGSEIGLFYYYFHSKDEVFDIAIERFLENYRPGLEEAFAQGTANPHAALSIFFEFIRAATVEFRTNYDATLHWAVRRAIRERSLEMMAPYLEKIIGLLIANGMQKPPIDTHILAVMLTNCVGGVILHMHTQAYLAALPEMKKAVHLLLGSPEGDILGADGLPDDV